MANNYTMKVANSNEMERVEELWHYCFEKREDLFFQWFFAEYCVSDNVLGAYNNEDAMQACLHLMPYNIMVRDAVLPISYVVGVSSLPEVRGQSVGGALLRAALLEMKSRKHYISLLMPFKAGFYYPYQWETCYWQYNYRLPINDLGSVAKVAWGKAIAVDVSNKKHITALCEIYENFVAGLHGFVVRDDSVWKAMISENKACGGFAYLLENDGQADGYIIYLLKDSTFYVIDWGFNDIKAQRQLLTFMSSHFSQVDFIEWQTPVNDLLCYILPNIKERLFLKPFMSARIVDVRGCLESLKYDTFIDSVFSLNIADELSEWNNKLFEIRINNGSATVKVLQKVIDTDIIECSIGALTQLVFGVLTVNELVKLGSIKCDNSVVVSDLNLVFTKKCNYCNEYF